MAEADVRARIDSQISREERRQAATHVIDNAGDRDSLERQVGALWSDLESLAQNPEPRSR